MFSNEYQGGTHVEVLGTQGQNPLAQWKVSGPQKGVQKVYDKALKGYVFVSSGACRLAMPKDDRATLGLVQPLLLLQLEVGVGTPLSLEVSITDAFATRRRIILSSSFSELKCTPLHCQVPFTGMPRESWINLVLPLADLAAVLFKVGGGGATAAAATAAGAVSSAGSAAAAAGGVPLGSMVAASGAPLSQATAASGNPAFRMLDSLQVAGTCRLRRICTLREMPPSVEGPEGGSASSATSSKLLEFPAGVDHQMLLLEPRSLSLVPCSSGGSPTQTMMLTTGGGGGNSNGAGLGVVGTSTGSSRRPVNGGGAAGSTFPGGVESRRVSVSMAGKSIGGGAAAAATAAAALAAAAPGGEDDGGGGPGSAASGLHGTAMSCNADDAAASIGQLSGASTPMARGGSAVPTLPPAFGATAGPSHHGTGSTDNISTPIRNGRTSSGGLSALTNGGSSTSLQHIPALVHNSSFGSGPLPSLESGQFSGIATSASGSGGGNGGLKLPRVQHNSPTASAASASGAVTGASFLDGDDSNCGDTSPFGSRRALSAQTPPRQSTSATPAGSSGGAGAGASGAAPIAGADGSVGGATATIAGKPPASPWSGSSTSKRAQSGPARISTEALAQVRLGRASVELEGLGDTMAPVDTPTSPSLAPRQARRTQNNSQIPPTIREHESCPSVQPLPATVAAPVPTVKSPARSPSRTRPQPSASGMSAAHGASGGASPAIAGGALRPAGGSSSLLDSASSSLPQMRHIRSEAALATVAVSRDQPGSPAVLSSGKGGANAFSQLNAVLTIRGGMEASIDLGAHSNVLDGSPGASLMLSSNLKMCSMTTHAHRYGGGVGSSAFTNGAATASAVGASGADSSSDCDGDVVLSPSGAGCGATTCSSAVTMVAAEAVRSSVDPVSSKVPRIRTRVIPGGGASGGGGGGGGNGKGGGFVDGVNGRTPSTPVAAPTSPGSNTRKMTGYGAEVDAPARGGRSTLTWAFSGSGRCSPANTPTKAGSHATPTGGAGAGPGPSNLGPGGNGVRQRKDDVPANGRPLAAAGVLETPAASATRAVSGGGSGSAGAAGTGGARSSGAVGGAMVQKPSVNGGGSVCTSPARQRPPASSATRGTARSNGTSGGAAAVDNRDRLPPLAAAGAIGGGSGRGRNGLTIAAARGGGAGVGGGNCGGSGRGTNQVAGRGMRPKRPTTSNEVDVEESITLTAGLWGGFGVDEDDDMLGSRHFRNILGAGSSGSDGELSGGVNTAEVSASRGLSATADGKNSSFVRRPSESNTPDVPPRGRVDTVDVPSPEGHYGYGTANGMVSPPIRRVAAAEVAGVPVTSFQEPGATFAGFPAPAGRHRSSVADGAAGGEGRPVAACHVLDSLLDEEALLAGYERNLDHYDDWAEIDQRPTPPELLNQHRAFTPPVVPASKSLGISIDASRGAGGGRGGCGTDAQTLRLGAPAAAVAAAAGRGGRCQGAVVAGGGEDMLDLVYDPVLNCYYDGLTGQYYELKT